MDEAEANAEKQFANSKSKGAEQRKADAKERARQEVLNQYLRLELPVKGRFRDPADIAKGR